LVGIQQIVDEEIVVVHKDKDDDGGNDDVKEEDGGMVEALPWLYLGPMRCIEEILFGGNRRGITHVLTVNALQPPSRAQELYYLLLSRDIQHGYVPTLDVVGYDLLPAHWDECYDFLRPVYDEFRRQSGPHHRWTAFVHCEAGINRSGTVAVAAMMAFDGVPLLQAVRTLKTLRGTIVTNPSFQQQLVVFANRCGCLGTTTSPVQSRTTTTSGRPMKEEEDEEDEDKEGGTNIDGGG
jgi:hypothetical protein